MKLLNCPLNGLRNIAEFTYGGEYHPLEQPAQCTDAQWAEHVYFHENLAGRVIEWWCHTASAYWFLVERDATSDAIIRTIKASELFTARFDYVGQSEAGE